MEAYVSVPRQPDADVHEVSVAERLPPQFGGFANGAAVSEGIRLDAPPHRARQRQELEAHVLLN